MMMPSRQILFADDDVLTQWIMTEILTKAGFSVVSACRGAEAMALLDCSPDFDLLLTDVDLPDHVDGYELGDRWAAVLPGRPALYTGVRRGPTIPVLQQHEYFIEKPLDAAKLLRLVCSALEDASFRPLTAASARRSQPVH